MNDLNPLRSVYLQCYDKLHHGIVVKGKCYVGHVVILSVATLCSYMYINGGFSKLLPHKKKMSFVNQVERQLVFMY